jgi:hypothetical protein
MSKKNEIGETMNRKKTFAEIICNGVSKTGENCSKRQSCTLFAQYVKEYLTPHQASGDDIFLSTQKKYPSSELNNRKNGICKNYKSTNN